MFPFTRLIGSESGLLATLVIGTFTFGSLPAAEPVKLPGLEIDVAARCVNVEATVCLDEGTLELVACTKGTKEHESILVLGAKAVHVHTALLLLGAENGQPAQQRRIESDDGGERWVDLPPSGGEVELSLVVEGEDGKPVERPIADFIKPAGEGREETAFPTSRFLFAGSMLVDDPAGGARRYLADASGHAVTLSTFGDELICLPGIHAHANAGLLWAVDPTHLPEVGTEVVLRLRPVAAETEPGGAAKKEP